MVKSQELGMKALAITDHGAMYGCVDFYKGVKGRDQTVVAAKSMSLPAI